MTQAFSIGRLSQETDPILEELAEIEAERLQPTPAMPKSRKFMTCKHCRQTGYTGGYPFSTNPGSGLCDDCM
jgi:hypothetical protein